MSNSTNPASTGHIDPKSVPSVSPGTGDSADTVTLSPSGLCRFQAYDPKSPTAATLGGRMVSICYKGKKVDGELIAPKLANSCIEVPLIKTDEVKEQIEQLLPHVVSYLETVQDSIAKELHSRNTGEAEQEEAFNLSAILVKLEATTTTSRLSKEQAEQWFDSEVADNLAVLFADKFGISDNPSEAEIDKVAAICNVYRKNLSALAGPKTNYKVSEAQMLQKVLDMTDARDSVIGGRMYSRLDKMITDATITPAMIGLD